MVKCSILNCKNYEGKKGHEKIRFFGFPKESALVKKWITACGKHAKLTLKGAKICSKHFTETDYTLQDIFLNTPQNKRHLRKEAIPNIHLPESIKITEREKRYRYKLRTGLVQEAINQFERSNEETIMPNDNKEIPAECIEITNNVSVETEDSPMIKWNRVAHVHSTGNRGKGRTFIKRNNTVRGQRASHFQITYLVDFMLKNKEVACGLCKNRDNYKKKWEQLACELNSLGKSCKTTEQWRTTWRDLKSHTTAKIKSLVTSMDDIENRDFIMNTNDAISDVDRKILLAVGYVWNSSDQTVVVNEESKSSLEQDNQNVEKSSAWINQQLSTFKDSSSPAVQFPMDIIHFNGDSSSISIDVRNEPEDSWKRPFVLASPKSSKSEKRYPDSPLIADVSTKRRRKDIKGRRLKDRFMEIAELQTKNMTIFAEAFSKLADAMGQIANATDKFAEASLIQAKNAELKLKMSVSNDRK